MMPISNWMLSRCAPDFFIEGMIIFLLNLFSAGNLLCFCCCCSLFSVLPFLFESSAFPFGNSSFWMPQISIYVSLMKFMKHQFNILRQLLDLDKDSWVERGTVRVKCLAQEHNTMSSARARTRTARSGEERTNHEAPAPPTCRSL